MNIDIKTIMLDTLMRMFESNIYIIAIVFVVAIASFISRYEIESFFNLSQKETNKLIEKTLFVSTIIGIATIFYLYAKEYYFLLSISISVILTYFLYQFGFFDMVIEKWEDKNGRW